MHPILFQFRNFTVESYWFFMILSFIAAGVIVFWQAKKQNLDLNKAKYLIITTIISGFIGARIVYVFLNFSRYQKDPLRILQFWKGGLSWQGAFLIGFLVLILLLKDNRKKAGKWFDAIIFGVLLGHSIGRIGCFLEGCCYGITTNIFWAIKNPSLGDDLLRHPTQLYEVFGYLAIFLLLYFYSKKNKLKDGSLFFIGTILHSSIRFIVEYFRYNRDFICQGNTWYGTLSYAQFTALIIIIISFLILLGINHKKRLKITTKQNSN